MSRVTLLAADQPMPAHVSKTGALTVEALSYYQNAVELLGLDLKPFRYELELEDTPQGAQALQTYLRSHCTPGSSVQLWNLWVGDTNVRALHLTGPLDALDAEALWQLRERDQTCITVSL